ncbi:hypothetical protein BJ912DRAFT_972542 [Pholiota molesta]|nr:hypothetical protein BJ912DRAFT_972542 [Pholiota molesta]
MADDSMNVVCMLMVFQSCLLWVFMHWMDGFHGHRLGRVFVSAAQQQFASNNNTGSLILQLQGLLDQRRLVIFLFPPTMLCGALQAQTRDPFVLSLQAQHLLVDTPAPMHHTLDVLVQAPRASSDLHRVLLDARACWRCRHWPRAHRQRGLESRVHDELLGNTTHASDPHSRWLADKPCKSGPVYQGNRLPRYDQFGPHPTLIVLPVAFFAKPSSPLLAA